MEKILTSRREREKRVTNSLGTISIIDREAIVEYYLLEDIHRLYKYRLEKEERMPPRTEAEQIEKESNIKKFNEIIKLFDSVLETAWSLINSGAYAPIYRAIPEHALYIAAGNIKYLPQLKELAIGIVKDLSAEELEAKGYKIPRSEKWRDPPTMEKVNELLEEVNAVIPDEKITKITPKKPAN